MVGQLVFSALFLHTHERSTLRTLYFFVQQAQDVLHIPRGHDTYVSCTYICMYICTSTGINFNFVCDAPSEKTIRAPGGSGGHYCTRTIKLQQKQLIDGTPPHQGWVCMEGMDVAVELNMIIVWSNPINAYSGSR